MMILGLNNCHGYVVLQQNVLVEIAIAGNNGWLLVCLAVSLCRPRYAVSRPLSCIVAADVTASECAYVYDECAFTLWQLLPFFIGAVIDVMEQSAYT